MALNLGELSIGLELENDRLRAGMGAAKKELQSLPPVARQEMVKVSRVFDEEGRKAGGKLSQGINQGLIRNSPLIVAGIGAALSAGAPVMLAAAGTLFGGLGAVAAAQTSEVRAAWTDLGHDVRDGAVSDAAVLVPVYTEMAGQIGSAFERMRPQLREAFADSAPLIQSFSGGIIDLAENAMPGLVGAVQNGQPVFDGLESFLASTGTGLSDFFDAISGHSPAAGAAFASIGDILADLLPILGELLGQGAELAEDVLPAVASATGLTLDVVRALGPALPAVVMGIAGMKIAGSVSGGLGTLAAKLGDVSTKGGAMAGTAGKVAGGMSAASKAGGVLGGALGVLGLAYGAYTAYQERANAQAERFADLLREGGAAADKFRAGTAEIVDEHEFMGKALDDVNGKLREQWEAMTPVEQAQSKMAEWTATLAARLTDEGASADDVSIAQERLAHWTGESEAAQAELELATLGVTSAMIEQGEQALAMIDSGFAYRKSVDDLEDAQAKLKETIRNRTNADKDLRTTNEDVQRAQLALEEQAYNTALAFGQQQADLSGLSSDSEQYKRLIQEEMLGELHRLRDAAGPEMKAALDQQIAMLEASGVSLQTAATAASIVSERMRGLGVDIRDVPGYKGVEIDAPTAEQQARIEGLGLTVVRLPNGRVYVTADTADAAARIQAIQNQINALHDRTITITTRGAQADVAGVRRFGIATGGPVRDAPLIGYDSGGPVWGPGGPTDDLVRAIGPDPRAEYRLSNDEHIWTAREVAAAGGHGAVAGIRQAALAGAFKFADGGGVPRGAAGTAAAVTAGSRRGDAPIIEMNNVTIADQGDAIRVAQDVSYLFRTRG